MNHGFVWIETKFAIGVSPDKIDRQGTGEFAADLRKVCGRCTTQDAEKGRGGEHELPAERSPEPGGDVEGLMRSFADS